MKKSMYFLGGLQNCIICRTEELPSNARYVCNSEGYAIYDSNEFEEKYYACKANVKPIIARNGRPVEYNETMVEFSK